MVGTWGEHDEMRLRVLDADDYPQTEASFVVTMFVLKPAYKFCGFYFIIQIKTAPLSVAFYRIPD